MNQGFIIHEQASLSKRKKGRQTAFRLLLAALVLSVLAAAAIPAVRNSLMMLLNCLFDASEQVNHYVYQHFDLPAGTGLQEALSFAIGWGAILLGLLLLAKCAVWPLCFALLLACSQAYFGLSLPLCGNLLLFLLLGCLAVLKQYGWRASAACLCIGLAAGLLIAAVLPGVHPGIEAASERVRDWMGSSFEEQVIAEGTEASGLLETRHENLRDLNDGTDAAISDEEYRLITVAEQQIGLPHWVDYLRILGMLLLVPIALAVPFLPFIWMNKQTQKAMDKRACFQSEDPREAILGGFALVTGYLDACGIGSGERLYLDRL